MRLPLPSTAHDRLIASPTRWRLTAGLVAFSALLVAATAIAEPAKPDPSRRGVAPPARDQARIAARRVRDWQLLKQRNIVMQRTDYSCGAAALATVCRYYWQDAVTEQMVLDALDEVLTVEEIEDRVKNGLTMTDLRKAAVKMGYQAAIGKLTFEKLTEAKAPVVVGITVDEYDHFVVYRGTDGYRVYLADPIRGNIRIYSNDFLKQWQKHAVLAVVHPKKKPPEISALTLRGDELFLGQVNDQFVRSHLRADDPNAPQPQLFLSYPLPP